jgi:dynein heavy chain, axonemal
MPLDYNENEVRELIKKLSGPKALGAVGYAVPLNIFLSQEIARMQVIFNIVRKTLVDACDAIDGQIIMTAEIMDSINAIFDARVPNQWVYDATGAEISWIIPTLAKWFNDLIERNKQLYEWMKGNRPYTFWLGGFFNPQGFLTAMKQEVTRMHKTGKPIGGGQIEPPWSLDDVVYQSTVKEKDQDLIREGRDKDVEGVYIR